MFHAIRVCLRCTSYGITGSIYAKTLGENTIVSTFEKLNLGTFDTLSHRNHFRIT